MHRCTFLCIAEHFWTVNYLCSNVVEGAVKNTTPKTEKRNADEGVALAPAQADAHVSAHAQHTNARTYNVWIATWDAHARLHTQRTSEKTYTRKALARIIADKHAKGYALITIMRWSFGTYDLVFEHKNNPASPNYCGRARMWHKAGRRQTAYAPVQEARE